MGFFDALKIEKIVIGTCLYCDSPIEESVGKNGNILQKAQYRLADNKCICPICLKQKKLSKKDIHTKTSSLIISLIKDNGMVAPDSFKPTTRIMRAFGLPYIEVDEPRQLINIPDIKFNIFSDNKYIERIFAFSALIDFELIDSGQKLMEGSSLLGATVGGLTFGGAGAIVGAGFGGKKVKDQCTELSIKVILNNINNSDVYISIIPAGGNTDRNSSTYKEHYSFAQKCMSTLTVILKQNSRQTIANDRTFHTSENLTSNDILESIRQLGKLRDENLLTAEEFDVKKQELLSRL